jgi:hypothetical protein
MIEDRDLDDEHGDVFDDDESLAASGLSASLSMPGGSGSGSGIASVRAGASAPSSPHAVASAPSVPLVGDVLQLNVGGLRGVAVGAYRDLQ